MFEKCISCCRMGTSCVPNLWLLPFPELIQWCIKRQKYLGWTSQDWSDKSTVPVGTINRIKAGEYMDAKYSTIKNLALALIGGTSDEFSCTEQVEKELRNLERFEQQAAKLTEVEAENERMKARFCQIDEMHRQDIQELKAEQQRKTDHLLQEIERLHSDVERWQMENDRKGRMIDKYMEKIVAG